jgi:hypothetical protein
MAGGPQRIAALCFGSRAIRKLLLLSVEFSLIHYRQNHSLGDFATERAKIHLNLYTPLHAKP